MNYVLMFFIAVSAIFFWRIADLIRENKKLTKELNKLENEHQEEEKCLIESSGFEDYNERLRKLKDERKQRIIHLFEEHEILTSGGVSDALGISTRTVVRYMNELEREAKVKQVGETGRGVFYKRT